MSSSPLARSAQMRARAITWVSNLQPVRLLELVDHIRVNAAPIGQSGSSHSHSHSKPDAHGLNLAQQEAVNYLHGPCLVLAGAGSGKTRVITHKIGRLIQMGMPAQRIAAITFTNKAAAEMRERAKGLIGRAAKDVLVCTFHALGVRMLRQDGAALGLKAQFSILDTDDVTSILKDAGGSTDAATARQWQWTISGWKSAGLNAQQALAQAEDDNARITATRDGALRRAVERLPERGL
jgi:ATP-dependent DNA helicase Rep